MTSIKILRYHLRHKITMSGLLSYRCHDILCHLATTERVASKAENMYFLMIFFAVAVSCLFARTFCVQNILVNLQIAVCSFIVYCYPLLLTFIIDITEDALFYLYSCNAFCISTIVYFFTRWWFTSEINQHFERIVNLHETTVADIALESSFNFPHTIQWAEIKADFEDIFRILNICFQQGDVRTSTFFLLKKTKKKQDQFGLERTFPSF